jgi:hypothetical protein
VALRSALTPGATTDRRSPLKTTYGEAVEMLRGFIGQRVRLQMRSHRAAGDHLTTSGLLVMVEPFLDQAVRVGLEDETDVLLHFDRIASPYIVGDSLELVYENGASFRCVLEGRPS